MPKKVDFSGVAGELVQSEGLGLEFTARKRKISPYDPLLIKLSNASPGTVLHFGDLRAENSIKQRAKLLEMRLSFARKGTDLYVKYEGSSHFDITEVIKDKVLSVVRDFEPIDTRRILKHLRHSGVEITENNVNDTLAVLRKEKEVSQDSVGSWGMA